MSIKNLVEMIKHNGLLASMSELEELYQVAIQNEQKLAESDARCAALAAENAGMKSIQEWAVAGAFKSGAKVFESTKAAGFDTDDCLHDAVLVMLSELKTPATDAFLSEVRAQARNELVDELEARFTELSRTSQTPELRSGAAGAAGFVSTFRKGVQS